MGVTTTPINAFSLPDDNELLRNVYAHMRNHAQQLESALRGRGLTSADVTGYLDLLGRVNTAEAALATLTYDSGNLFPAPATGFTTQPSTDARRLTVRRIGRMVQFSGILNRDTGTRTGLFTTLPTVDTHGAAVNLKPAAQVSFLGTSAGQPVMELYANTDGTCTVNFSVTAGLGCIFNAFWFAAS